MPIQNYGVLKGTVADVKDDNDSNPHYEVWVKADTDFRIAINVQSQVPPSEVAYLVVNGFTNPITTIIEGLPSGFTALESNGQSGALDYVRGGLFDRSSLQFLPLGVSDLENLIDGIMQRAMNSQGTPPLVYAFGQRFGPQQGQDDYFPFSPQNGIHDIHMNQGNVGRFVDDDGPWQDGGLLVQFPDQNEWVAVFLKFQSQSWNTDDTTGHTIDD